MASPENLNALAVKVARLYHYQGLTTGDRRELGLSRSKISRLLTHARQAGLIEIRIPRCLRSLGTGARDPGALPHSGGKSRDGAAQFDRGRMAEICGSLRRKTYQ